MHRDEQWDEVWGVACVVLGMMPAMLFVTVIVLAAICGRG